jgi:hypothetical protein
MRLSRQRPPGGSEIGGGQIGAGLHETLFIHRDATLQPRRGAARESAIVRSYVDRPILRP